MKSFFKIFAILFAILCVVSAYLQLNDPDPFLWVWIYIIAAIAAVLFTYNKLPYQVYVLLFIGYGIGAFLFWPDTFEGVTIGEGDINNIENARESLGLAILGIVMLIFGIRVKNQ